MMRPPRAGVIACAASLANLLSDGIRRYGNRRALENGSELNTSRDWPRSRSRRAPSLDSCRWRAFLKAGDVGALADQRQHGIDSRGGAPDPSSQFLNRGDQRVDLHCAMALEVLEHRGLMRADATRAIDPPLDIDPEMDAEALADRLSLEHHRPRHVARAGIRADDVERGTGQCADRI